YEFMGDEDIPYERYTSQEFFNLEIEKMWSKTWQWACRDEHIPEVGDNYVYDVGPYSILVVRHGEGPGDVKAYHNSCLHRGTQLKPSHSQGNSPKLRCPFHGWEWNLDGSINEIPCRWDFPKLTDEDVQLPEVNIGHWGGFFFINMDPDCMPLEEYLGVLPKHFANWPLENRYIRAHVQKTLPSNWKASQEAFVEAYHSLERIIRRCRSRPISMPNTMCSVIEYRALCTHLGTLIPAGQNSRPKTKFLRRWG
ncbi:MAG: aromatic ring-hydroxylating dioxygenase subunit alpha, partial [Proteobacteria bacterium]|nr:aromatic ring-hydroxylating dioxygenase subunit alpha [Pseudomonadota bacterium]